MINLPPIKHFELKKEIGNGYNKSVWEATRISDGSRWALKFKDQQPVAQAQSYKRKIDERGFWRKEGLNGKATGFDNVAFCYVDQAMDGTPFLVEEYIDRFLSDRLNEDSSFSLDELLHIGMGLASGLDVLHKKVGVVHGDLKPENIGYSTDGVIKISDFGTASQGNYKRYKIGTPLWRAPENFYEPASFTSDIWSFGALLYFLKTGTHVLADKYVELGETNYAHFITDFSKSSDWNAEMEKRVRKAKFPLPLFAVVSKSLANKENRIKNGSQLSELIKTANDDFQSGFYKRMMTHVIPAVGSIALAAGMFMLSEASTKVNESEETIAYHQRVDVVRSLLENDRTRELLKIKYLEAKLGDPQTAILAYLRKDIAVRAIHANNGETDFESLLPYVKQKFPEFASELENVFLQELPPGAVADQGIEDTVIKEWNAAIKKLESDNYLYSGGGPVKLTVNVPEWD